MCGREGALVRRVTRSFGKGEGLLVIENIPYVFCPSCGERYFTAGTLREIERIKALKTTRIRRKPIPIVSFGVA